MTTAPPRKVRRFWADRRRSRYLQAVPIFSSADREVARLLHECNDEIDAITGHHVIIPLAREVRAAQTVPLVDGLNLDDRDGRYAGLGFTDMPCLWIEDAFKRSAVVRLPRTQAEIMQVFRILADVSRRTKDAPQVAEEMKRRMAVDAGERSPVAAYLGRLLMDKSSERRIAVICGVVFVSVILVVAFLIPQPTVFQYTIFRIVLALAAAGFVSMTDGFLELKLGGAIKAGGALAVFAIVYFYAPAALPAAH